MAFRTLPDQEYLRQCFTYDPETGELRWKKRPVEHFPNLRICLSWNAKYAYTKAGYINKFGYRAIGIYDINFQAHRLIYKLVVGQDPPDEIDHRNRDRADNRWANLRKSNSTDNRKNSAVHGNNTVGLKGVWLKGNRFYAKIVVDGRRVHLGGFATKEEAHAAYCAAAKTHFGEFWSDGH